MRCYCPTIVPVECIGDDGENLTDGCPHITCPHCRGTIDNGVKSPDANGVMCRTQGEVVRIVDKFIQRIRRRPYSTVWNGDVKPCDPQNDMVEPCDPQTDMVESTPGEVQKERP